MARPPKGKPLTLRPIRLDDDVWAECQRLGKEHGTINEGLRVGLLLRDALNDRIEDLETAWPSAEYPLPQEKQRPFKPPLLKPSEKK